jgi:hypothetical protein
MPAIHNRLHVNLGNWQALRPQIGEDVELVFDEPKGLRVWVGELENGEPAMF